MDRIMATPLLDCEARLKYRRVIMRASYLAADSPSISEVVKMLAHAMSKPR